MDHKEAFEIMRDIIAEAIEAKRVEVTLDANLATELGADSLDLVQIVMDVELAFEKKTGCLVEITDEEIERLYPNYAQDMTVRNLMLLALGEEPVVTPSDQSAQEDSIVIASASHVYV